MQLLHSKIDNVLQTTAKTALDVTSLQMKQGELATSLEVCHQNIDDIKSLIAAQDAKITGCSNEMSVLQGANNLFIYHLETELNDLVQYSHINNLIIYGIPETPSENLSGILKRLALPINFDDWSDLVVDAMHRLGKPNLDGRRPIMVKFVRRIDRDSFLHKRKVKRNLNFKDLGYSNERIIYINESLTKNNRMLFSDAQV